VTVALHLVVQNSSERTHLKANVPVAFGPRSPCFHFLQQDFATKVLTCITEKGFEGILSRYAHPFLIQIEIPTDEIDATT
jgi:hypothetical protein